MRSATATRERPSLLGRVALASGLAAALGGVIAAGTAGLTTRELVEGADDDELRAAARELVEELLEDDDDDPLAEELADELDDLDLPGARAAVRIHGRLVAGDASLPAIEPGSCEWADELHVCAVSADDLTLVLGASAARAHALEPLFAWGAALGILLGSLAGALVSARSARWALRPLDRLRAQIDAIDADAPSSAALSPPAEHAEIEALRAATADLVDRLGAALANAQRFALDAAHELQTPLTAITGELELLAESDAPDPVALARIRASTAELVALVQRLLLLAAPPAGAEAPREAVDFADVAAEVRQALPPRGAERVAIAAEEDVIVRGDPVLLRVALGNAVDNALKFSEGAVRVRVFARRGEAHVEIEDEGPGVSPKDRARVFEPFYRSAHARASAGGHGLGLAIIAHAVASHGGRARFADVPRGARLCIVLPRWRDE